MVQTSWSTEIFEVTINAGDTYVVNHEPDPDTVRVVSVKYDAIDPGPEVWGAWTPYDPNNYSTTEANINDWNFWNFRYNNSSSWPTWKRVWIDLWSSKIIESVKVFDYSSWDTYIANDFNIDYSDDGTNWSTASSIVWHNYSPESQWGASYSFPAQSWRYWRIVCVTPNNSSWWVLSELQIFEQWNNDPYWLQAPLSDIRLISSTVTEVVNNTWQDRNYKIWVYQP